MQISDISERGLAFIAGHEGCVFKAYRCPAGVLTIGYGFTNRSPAVTSHLGRIRPGMRITREKADQVLRAVIAEEFAPMTAKAMGAGAKQYHFDMGVSAAYNCEPRAFRWKWLKEYRAGRIKAAAARWRRTATTANGRRLPGLVRRRAEEADLLEYGNYGKSHMPRFEPARTVQGVHADVSEHETLREYQGKL